MRPLPLAVLTLLATALVALAPPPAGAAAKRCGTVAGEPTSGAEALILADVRATNLKCRTARSVAKSWRRSSRCAASRTPITSCSIRGYACRELSSRGETSRWRCRRASRTVSFGPGS